MPSWKYSLHLNIRQKVVLGLTAGILGIGFIGILSYHYLREIEVKQGGWREPTTSGTRS